MVRRPDRSTAGRLEARGDLVVNNDQATRILRNKQMSRYVECIKGDA